MKRRSVKMLWRGDCRHFRGDRPCRPFKECAGCSVFSKWEGRHLIVKLGAKGDVLRTTPLAEAIKKRHPGAFVAWLTEAESAPLLQLNPFIDRILPYNTKALVQLAAERYDAVYIFDKEPWAAGLSSIIDAKKKHGFGWQRDGHLGPLSRRSETLFLMGLSDRIKFHENRKSYQQLVIEASGFAYAGEGYTLRLKEEETAWAKAAIGRMAPKRRGPLIGINTGIGRAFPTKAWPEGHYADLVRMAHKTLKAKCILLGGELEKGTIARIKRSAPEAIAAAPNMSLRQLCSMISCLDLVVSPDSLAMHVGIALKRPVVALFGPTCAQEIDLYGMGEKLSARADCAPCYRQACDDRICMRLIKPDRILHVLERLWR